MRRVPLQFMNLVNREGRSREAAPFSISPAEGCSREVAPFSISPTEGRSREAAPFSISYQPLSSPASLPERTRGGVYSLFRASHKDFYWKTLCSRKFFLYLRHNHGM